MEIFALSLNHRVTPLRVRESVAFNREEGERFLRWLRSERHSLEAVLISTCNRTELYSVGESESTLDEIVLDLLRRERGFEPKDSPRNYEVFRNEDAVRHLFAVVAGLDSQILGESQILGQVKASLRWAREAETSGRVLSRLYERALRVGKRVRTETAIGQGALSASYAALELAKKIFGTLEDKRVLVIGTGKIGVLALENLQGVSLGALTIMNRTRSVAEELAIRFGGSVRDFGELPDALTEADLVISSTGAKEPLIRYDQMKKIRQRRRGERPILIVDLAIPRDFDEACGTLDEVFLKNLDDLTEIAHSNAEGRREEIPRAQAIIDRDVTTFYRWLQSLEVEPTIRKLRELFEGIRDEEIRLLDAQLGEDELRRVSRFGHRLVNHLLHVLSSNLRRHEGLRGQDLISLVHEILTEQIPHPGGSSDEED